VAQHDRQRDESHGDDRGGHHAGGRGQQPADEDHGVGETTAHRAEELTQGVEQFFGHAAAFQHQAHEGEERDRQQRVVLHDPVHPLRQCLQQQRLQQAQLHAHEAEQQSHRRQRERHRIAEQQDHHQAGKHQGPDVRDQPRGHAVLPSPDGLPAGCGA
jgi:hypothetical protein